MTGRQRISNHRGSAAATVVVLAACLASALTAPPAGADPGTALRFYGNGVDAPDLDRVKIRIDDPANADPGPPADIGGEDFTVEFWMRASAAENSASAVSCGFNNNWINGNIVIDRDRFNQPAAYGISIAGGNVVFGVDGELNGSATLCSSVGVLDGQWHHVAAQRRRSDGWMWLFVDGQFQSEVDGPDGDVSYPNNGVPGNYCGGPCTNSDPFIVIGAEKHDAGSSFPSCSGWLDELRLSNDLRYPAGGFPRPTDAFVSDVNTVALYHLDEGMNDVIADTSGAIGGPSDGVRRFGGVPAGPQWVVSDAPLGDQPPDVTPPTPPTNLRAAPISDFQIVLDWEPSSDDTGVAGYRVFRGTTLVGTVQVPGFVDSGLTAATNHTYEVVSFDFAGNESTPSNTAAATTLPEPPPISTVDFDDPMPQGAPDSPVAGIFEGIDFGGQWRWSGPFAADPTNSAYFDADVTSRSFAFASGPRVLQSMGVYTSTNSGTLTLSDDQGQTVAQPITPGSMHPVVTAWSQPANTVTVDFTAGWNLGIDDIVFFRPDTGGRVSGLILGKAAGGALALDWNASCATGDDDYAIYEGVLGDFTSHVALSCSTVGSTSETIAASAGVRYYLVVPRTEAGEGSYGRDGDGLERPAGVMPCVPRSPQGCPGS